MKKILILLAALLLPALVFAQSVLRISAIPDGTPEEVQSRYSLLASYLEAETKTKIEFVYLRSYEDVIAALVQKKIEMAYVGGFAFVQVEMMTGDVNPLVQRAEDAAYVSVIIANAHSGIEKLTDIKGKLFSFGPLISTSGSLMPRYFLREENMVPEKDFKRVSYSKGHEATERAVEGGRVDAGAMSGATWDRMVAAKKVNEERVKVIWTSPPYIDNTWMVTGAVDQATSKKLTDAFLKLDSQNSEHKAILDVQHASRYIKNSADNYVNIDQAARRAGLLGCQPWACERP
jgi:phosphonate transport system substrate-binding protein